MSNRGTDYALLRYESEIEEYLTGRNDFANWIGPALLSTLFTSIWTILILVSTTVLKLLAPVQRFTRWFFDVDEHPLRAVGVVSAALVMIGGLVWTVLRAVI
jgi:hypothetical protein